MDSNHERLKKDYPWIQTPLVVGAPMRLISLAPLAVEISRAGGIGFIAGGTDVATLPTHVAGAHSLLRADPIPNTPENVLPIGIGVICWGADLSATIPQLREYQPAALWLFAPKSPEELSAWVCKAKDVSPQTKIWVQVGSVQEAVDAVRAVRPDVLVVQGTDAGGHGLVRGAGVVSLVPEVSDAVRELCRSEGVPEPILIAAGGIVEERGAAAALALGAQGVAMGTRFLAAKEAHITAGYRDEVLRASDGGQTTVRTKVYDELRGTTGWDETHNARGVINKSFEDAVAGMDLAENKKLYEKEMERGDAGWGKDGRMTTYAGAGVGLVKEVKNAAEIVKEVRDGAREVLKRLRV